MSEGELKVGKIKNKLFLVSSKYIKNKKEALRNKI